MEQELKELRILAKNIHRTAREKGWWTKYNIHSAWVLEIVSSKLMLVVSELAEALEEERKQSNEYLYYSDTSTGERYVGPWDVVEKHMREHRVDGVPKPEGLGIELADAIIRILDLAEWLHIDIAEMIDIKMMYNEGRSYRHGGKRL